MSPALRHQVRFYLWAVILTLVGILLGLLLGGQTTPERVLSGLGRATLGYWGMYALVRLVFRVLEGRW